MKRDRAPALILTLGLGALAVVLVMAPLRFGAEHEIRDAEWMEDASGALGAAEVKALPRDRFRPLEGSVSVGFGAAPRWIRFRIDAGGPISVSRALVFPYPLVENLDLYLFDGNGGFQHMGGGISLAASERRIGLEGGVHVARFDLEPGTTVVVLRVQTRGPGFLGVSVLAPDALAGRQHVLLVLGAAFGALLVLLVFSTRFAWADRRRAGLELWGFLVAQTYYLGVMSGALAAVWRGSAGLMLAQQPIAGAASTFLGIAYLRTFLRLRGSGRKLDRAFTASTWLVLVAAALTPFSIVLGNQAVAIAVLGMLAIGAYAGAEVMLRGDRVERGIIPGFVLVMVATAALALALLGVVTPTPLLILIMIVAAIVAGTSAQLALARRAADEAVAREKDLGAALAASEERFRTAFKTCPEAMALARLHDGVFVAVNDAFTRFTGRSEAEIVGTSAAAAGMWVDPADRVNIVARLEQEGAIRGYELRMRRADGAIRVVSYSAGLASLDGVPHLLSIACDVTDERSAAARREHLEAELRQAQKLEALGRLAAGVAHDFNNFLTVISANVDVVLADLAEDDPRRESLEDALDTTRRAAALTRQLLAFTRRQPVAPRTLSLTALVEDLRKLLAKLVGDEARLTLDLARELPAVRADPGQLEQVVVNLVVNARDAVAAGGHVRVETAAVEQPAADGRPGGRYVRLTVRDDGVGMDASTRQRIFEPFFTTKAQGRGTGLGLSTVYGVAQRHGGFVLVRSEPGQGSAFEVYFPAHAGAEEPPAVETRVVPVTGCETVLVVEDTAAVRGAAAAVLRTLGYRTLVAGSGAEAIAICERERHVDLLLTDVRMPGMTGPQLARRLAAVRPQLRVLYMTGYGGEALDALDPDDALVLAKPFTIATVAEHVRAALSGPAAAPRLDRAG